MFQSFIPCSPVSSQQIPCLEIVVASEPCPAGGQGRDLGFFCEIAAQFAGAHNDTFD